MLKLEPVVWGLFGAGMFVAGLLYPAFLLVATLMQPLGVLAPDALSFERAHALAAHPIGRVVLAAAVAFPLWAGAHHVRHVNIDFGGIGRDAWFGALCYALALVGSVAAVLAVARL
jgi:fumarate reductase subunit D